MFETIYGGIGQVLSTQIKETNSKNKGTLHRKKKLKSSLMVLISSLFSYYAHIEVVVTFLVVNFLVFRR